MWLGPLRLSPSWSLTMTATAWHANAMGALRRLGQSLGLIYQDDGTWRPWGSRTPPTTPESRTGRNRSTDGVAKRPWWKTTNTARLGFIFAGIFLFIGLGGMVLLLVASVNGVPGHWYWLVVTALWLLIGTAHLASAVALRRREQSARPPGQAADP